MMMLVFRKLSTKPSKDPKTTNGSFENQKEGDSCREEERSHGLIEGYTVYLPSRIFTAMSPRKLKTNAYTPATNFQELFCTTAGLLAREKSDSETKI